MKIGELFMELGFKADTVKVNDFINMIGKLNMNSIMAAAGVDGLYNGLKNIMEVGSGLTEPMYTFNRETGLSAQKMQQWAEYAIIMGVSGDVVASSLSGLQKKMAAMQFGDASLLNGIYLLQQAGARINQNDLNNPFNFLEKATEGLQKIKPELRTYVAGLLGLNDQILLLKSFKGTDLLPAPTAQQVQNIRDYGSAWAMVGIQMSQVMTDIASSFAPDLKNLGESISGFFAKLHEDGKNLRGVLESIVGVIALFTGPIGQVGYLLAMVATHLKDIQKFQTGVGGFQLPTAGFATVPIVNTASLLAPVREAVKNITQQNTITIIAHNIEDLEHKFTHFMEKTIDKAFRQNSVNY